MPSHWQSFQIAPCQSLPAAVPPSSSPAAPLGSAATAAAALAETTPALALSSRCIRVACWFRPRIASRKSRSSAPSRRALRDWISFGGDGASSIAKRDGGENPLIFKRGQSGGRGGTTHAPLSLEHVDLLKRLLHTLEHPQQPVAISLFVPRTPVGWMRETPSQDAVSPHRPIRWTHRG